MRGAVNAWVITGENGNPTVRVGGYRLVNSSPPPSPLVTRPNLRSFVASRRSFCAISASRGACPPAFAMCASCPVAATLAPVTSARQQPTPTPPSSPPSPGHQSRPVSRPSLFAHAAGCRLSSWYTAPMVSLGLGRPGCARWCRGTARRAAGQWSRSMRRQCRTPHPAVFHSTRSGQRHARKSATLLVPGWLPWPPGTRIAKPERRHALRLHASSTHSGSTHHTHSAPPPLRSHERQLCPGSSSVAPFSIRLATHAQVGLAMRERYPVLRDISASIQTRRTVEESELALKLEKEFRADPCRKQCRQRGPKRLSGRG